MDDSEREEEKNCIFNVARERQLKREDNMT